MRNRTRSWSLAGVCVMAGLLLIGTAPALGQADRGEREDRRGGWAEQRGERGERAERGERGPRAERPGRGRGGGMGLGMRGLAQLDLSDRQREAVLEIFEEHGSQVRESALTMAEQRRTLAELMRDVEARPDQLRQQAAVLGERIGDHAVAMSNLTHELRGVLDEQQLETFQQMHQGAMLGGMGPVQRGERRGMRERPRGERDRPRERQRDRDRDRRRRNN